MGATSSHESVDPGNTCGKIATGATGAGSPVEGIRRDFSAPAFRRPVSTLTQTTPSFRGTCRYEHSRRNVTRNVELHVKPLSKSCRIRHRCLSNYDIGDNVSQVMLSHRRNPTPASVGFRQLFDVSNFSGKVADINPHQFCTGIFEFSPTFVSIFVSQQSPACVTHCPVLPCVPMAQVHS